MPLSMLNILRSAYCAQPIAPSFVRTKTSEMRLGSMHRWKQHNHERVGCGEILMPGAEARSSGSSL